MKKKLVIMMLLAGATLQVPAQKFLSLEESISLAVKNNVEIRNSNLETEAAKKVKESAYTKYFPEVSAGLQAFRSIDPLFEMESSGGNLPVYDGNPINLLNPTQFAYLPGSSIGMLKKGIFGNLMVAQPLYVGGRIENGNRLAELGTEVKTLQVRMAESEVKLKVEEQYWQIVALAEKEKTVDKYETLLNRVLMQVNDAVKNGLLLKNEALKVQLKINELKLNRSKLQNGKKLATMAFCQYIGLEYDPAIKLADTSVTRGLPESYLVDHKEALGNRTEYLLLNKAVTAEELLTVMKKGEFLPQVAVGAAGLYFKIDEGKGTTTGLLFGSVSVPISAWWSGKYELEERHIKEDIARNNTRDKSELLLLQMEKAKQDLIVSYDQILLAEETRQQAEMSLSLNDESYRMGLTTVSDLLESQAVYQQALEQMIDARTTYAAKVAEYLKVTGR